MEKENQWLTGGWLVGGTNKAYTYLGRPTPNHMSDRKIEYVLICDKVILDKDTDKASAIGIFHGFILERDTPFAIVPVEILIRIRGALGAKNAKVRIINPDGTELDSIDLQGENKKSNLNLICKFAALRFDQVGRYEIVTSVDGEQLESVATSYFDVARE
jgi:hypothetical protein